MPSGVGPIWYYTKLMQILIFLTLVVAASPVMAEPRSAPWACPALTSAQMSQWRQINPGVGESSSVIALLKLYAHDDAPSSPAWRARGHLLFQHVSYRVHSVDSDASIEALARAFAGDLTVEERRSLRERASWIVTSIFTNDPDEWRRFREARRAPHLTRLKVKTQRGVLALAERRHARETSLRRRRKLNQIQRSLYLLEFERLLVRGADCAPGLSTVDRAPDR